MNILNLLAGVALFLFGLKLMGDGLKSIAGNKLEIVLYRLSNTTLKGVLLGTGITAIIQSSGATSVMAVGFVNSGMMKLKQAVSIILGSILGTSITGWIICLNYLDGATGIGKYLSSSTITCIVAVIGIVMTSFMKGDGVKKLGGILMGFAVLMFGMSTMSNAVSTLSEQESFRHILISLSNPILGLIAGIVFTAILQSASSAVGIIQALSVTGTITIEIALPLLMGVTIGAAVPVLLASIGATPTGKRASLIYPVATVLSVMTCASVLYVLDAMFNFGFMDQMTNPFVIASVNTILRLIMVLILLPFTDVIEAVVTAMVKERDDKDSNRPVLEEMFISHPALAIDQSRKAIVEMAKKSGAALGAALDMLFDYSKEQFDTVEELENNVDEYEDSLGTYLVKLTGRELTKNQNKDVSVFLHTLTDLERVSDHAVNIAESSKEMNDKEMTFSNMAVAEFKVLRNALREVVDTTITAFINEDIALARNIEPFEELINELCDQIKLNHIDRLQRGECTIALGFVLNDLLTDFERVSDHCSNIAVAMIELEDDEFDTHKYINGLKDRRTEEYEAKLNEYRSRFSI